MNTTKLKSFTDSNKTVIKALKNVSTINLRDEARMSLLLLTEKESILRAFSFQSESENIYQYSWRLAYSSLKEKTGFCPYEMLNIDTSKNIKLDSIENLGLLPHLVMTIQDLNEKNT